MTPSIIRRFAKYHGLALECDAASVEWALEELARHSHGSLDAENVNKIVRSLTRIEDAEAILDSEAARHSNEWGAGYRAAIADIGNALIRRAGIDPKLWAEVKE